VLRALPRTVRSGDVAQQYLADFTGDEGVLFIGKAQEKASVFRTEKRRDARGVYPWIIRSTAMVNHYYVYLVDRDFGPCFIKFCSYFPYPAKLCLNRHEWLKRQLTQHDIPVGRFRPVVLTIGMSPDSAARIRAFAECGPEMARPAGLEPATPGLEGPSSVTFKKWPHFQDFLPADRL